MFEESEDPRIRRSDVSRPGRGNNIPVAPPRSEEDSSIAGTSTATSFSSLSILSLLTSKMAAMRARNKIRAPRRVGRRTAPLRIEHSTDN